MEAAAVDPVPDEVAAYAAVEMARPAMAAAATATTRRPVMRRVVGRSFMTIVLLVHGIRCLWVLSPFKTEMHGSRLFLFLPNERWWQWPSRAFGSPFGTMVR